jgi:hypothetical protein
MSKQDGKLQFKAPKEGKRKQQQAAFNFFDQSRAAVQKRRLAAIPKDRTTIDAFGLVLEHNKTRLYTPLGDDLRPRPESDFKFCIISKGRPRNVPSMEKHFKKKDKNCRPCWIVGKGETQAYMKQGATEVHEGGGLCASRNLAMDVARKENKICVELSDDVSSFTFLEAKDPEEWVGGGYKKCANVTDKNTRGGEAVRCSISPVTAARFIECQMRKSEAYLGGVYPNTNEGYMFGCEPVTKIHFIVGDFLIIDVVNSPNTRFDEEMTLKEDYDFTAQHLHQHGRICRVNRIAMKAEHYTNAGGAVAVRNAEREQQNIAILRRKWPGVFGNQKRENEVMMRWDWRDVSLGGKTKASERGKGAPKKAGKGKCADDMETEENSEAEGGEEEAAEEEEVEFAEDEPDAMEVTDDSPVVVEARAAELAVKKKESSKEGAAAEVTKAKAAEVTKAKAAPGRSLSSFFAMPPKPNTKASKPAAREGAVNPVIKEAAKPTAKKEASTTKPKKAVVGPGSFKPNQRKALSSANIAAKALLAELGDDTAVPTAEQVLQVFDKMGEHWPTQDRPNVAPGGKSNPGVRGMCLGAVHVMGRAKGEGMQVSAASHHFPEITQVLTRWVRGTLPDKEFPFSSLQINYNYRAKKHVDGNNIGPSYIYALGDHSGGQLWTADAYRADPTAVGQGGSSEKASQVLQGGGEATLDCRGQWSLFNGNAFHETQPYGPPKDAGGEPTGAPAKRISVIAFSNSSYNDMLPSVCNELVQGGFTAALSDKSDLQFFARFRVDKKEFDEDEKAKYKRYQALREKRFPPPSGELTVGIECYGLTMAKGGGWFSFQPSSKAYGRPDPQVVKLKPNMTGFHALELKLKGGSMGQGAGGGGSSSSVGGGGMMQAFLTKPSSTPTSLHHPTSATGKLRLVLASQHTDRNRFNLYGKGKEAAKNSREETVRFCKWVEELPEGRVVLICITDTGTYPIVHTRIHLQPLHRNFYINPLYILHCTYSTVCALVAGPYLIPSLPAFSPLSPCLLPLSNE